MNFGFAWFSEFEFSYLNETKKLIYDLYIHKDGQEKGGANNLNEWIMHNSGLPSVLSDAAYCDKVNAEYEQIKRNVLNRTGMIGNSADYDNIMNYARTSGNDPNQRTSPVSLYEEANQKIESAFSPESQHLNSSYYDNLNALNLNEHASILSALEQFQIQQQNIKQHHLIEEKIYEPEDHQKLGNPPLYDNLNSIKNIDQQEEPAKEPVVYKIQELVIDDDLQNNSLNETELKNFNEIIDHLDELKNLPNFEKTSVDLSANSSISSLNKVDEMNKNVIEQLSNDINKASKEELAETDKNSNILNDIIQQVLEAQNKTEQLEKLDNVEFKRDSKTQDEINLIKVDNLLIPKNRDEDTSKLDVEVAKEPDSPVTDDTNLIWQSIVKGVEEPELISKPEVDENLEKEINKDSDQFFFTGLSVLKTIEEPIFTDEPAVVNADEKPSSEPVKGILLRVWYLNLSNIEQDIIYLMLCIDYLCLVFDF